MNLPAPECAHRATLMHFTASPAVAGERACEYIEDGLLVVGGGRIVACGAADSLLDDFADVPRSEHADTLIVPGLVDTHIHFPQTGVIASYGTDLLNWLSTYTFPYEQKFSDTGYAEEQARLFLDHTLAAGTTTALVFASSYTAATDALFAEAGRRRLRLITGKVLMDRGAPSGLLDSGHSDDEGSRALIRKWHGVGRLSYAVTPRFALTSSGEQLSRAGKLLADHPDILMQTHLSENHDEVAEALRLFPDCRDYLDIYDRHGLVGERSVFAHGLHLGDGEWRRLSQAGSALSHCPTSNTFLGSGLFDFRRAEAEGVRVGLGTDVGGGNSYSLLRVMEEAYKISRLRGETLTPLQLWYHATLGGAVALRCDDVVGNFAPGKEADFVALDLRATPLIAQRLRQSRTPAEKLFAIAMLGGDTRIVRQSWVLGAPML